MLEASEREFGQASRPYFLSFQLGSSPLGLAFSFLLSPFRYQLSTARCCPLLEPQFSGLGKQGFPGGRSQILKERIQSGLLLFGPHFLELTTLLIHKLSCGPEILPKQDSRLEFLCVANEGISFSFHSNSLLSSSLPKATLTCSPCADVVEL